MRIQNSAIPRQKLSFGKMCEETKPYSPPKARPTRTPQQELAHLQQRAHRITGGDGEPIRVRTAPIDADKLERLRATLAH